MHVDRSHALDDAPLEELLTILLRQFKRLLAQCGLELNDAEIKLIATTVAHGGEAGEKALAVRSALAKLVAESEQVLAAWDLTFAQSLQTGMDAMPDWETTADFLEIANEKTNAELRIATGSALVTALGDGRYAHHLLTTVEHEADDPDGIIARRVLAFVGGNAADDDE